jgi:hypothetical protein
MGHTKFRVYKTVYQFSLLLHPNSNYPSFWNLNPNPDLQKTPTPISHKLLKYAYETLYIFPPSSSFTFPLKPYKLNIQGRGVGGRTHNLKENQKNHRDSSIRNN